MPQWNRTIKLGDLIAGWRAGEYGIEELADKVVERIEQSGWLDDTPYPDTLRDHLNGLKQATTPEGYQAAFNPVYDVADDDRVWIETW